MLCNQTTGVCSVEHIDGSFKRRNVWQKWTQVWQMDSHFKVGRG